MEVKLRGINVIAEIGINHNGDMNLVYDMVLAAKRCGADFVKFQKRDIDTCYTPEELAAPCDSPWGDTVEAKVRGRELSWEEFSAIDGICARQKIGWSASCFDLKSLDDLQRQFGDEITFHKVPSAMAIHRPFLEQVAAYKKLTLISVGLAPNFQEVVAIADLFYEAGCPFVINVTTSLYPCPPDRCNLERLSFFQNHSRVNRFGVGYSGHEVGILPSVIAAQMGARFIERHFTLDRSWYGADQAASLEPDGLRRLCRDIEELGVIDGSGCVALRGDEKNPVPTLKGGFFNGS